MPTYSSHYYALKDCACTYASRCSGVVKVGNQYKLAVGTTFMPSTSNPKTDSWKRIRVSWEVRQNAIISDNVKYVGSNTKSVLSFKDASYGLYYAKYYCLDWFECGGITHINGVYYPRRGTSFVDAPNSGETSYKMNVIYGDRW